MDSTAAKRKVAKVGGELAFDKDSKIWTLTVAGKSTTIENLKTMEAEDLEDEIAGLQAPCDDEGVELVSEAVVAAALPSYMIPAKYPKSGDENVAVTVNGEVIMGKMTTKYFFVMVDGKAKCGPASMVVDNAVTVG